MTNPCNTWVGRRYGKRTHVIHGLTHVIHGFNPCITWVTRSQLLTRAATQAPGVGTGRGGNAPFKGAHRLHQLGAQECPKSVTGQRSHRTKGARSAPTQPHRQHGARLPRTAPWVPAKRTGARLSRGSAEESGGNRSSTPTRSGWVVWDQAAVDPTTPARHGLVAWDFSQPCGRPPGQDKTHCNRDSAKMG